MIQNCIYIYKYYQVIFTKESYNKILIKIILINKLNIFKNVLKLLSLFKILLLEK